MAWEWRIRADSELCLGAAAVAVGDEAGQRRKAERLGAGLAHNDHGGGGGPSLIGELLRRSLRPLA